jgi:hypothetical protein
MKENPMTPEKVEQIMQEVAAILLKKNADYGGASFDLGLNGNMVHLWDKIRRYRNLVEKEQRAEQVNYESIEDTLRDIMGYATIGLLILGSQAKKTT